MKKLRFLLRQLTSSFVKRGIGRTIQMIPRKLKAKRVSYSVDEFDQKYNVETTNIVYTGELKTKSKNWKYASRYQPMPNFSLQNILTSFHIANSEYTFIDLGSGKGRVVLLASMLPFKEIIGVEFSGALNNIAKINISKFPEDLQLCKNIKMIEMDAVEYLFPNPHEKFILFMNNPFENYIMEKVIENFSKSFFMNPRQLIIIYFNPKSKCRSLIDSLTFMQKNEAINGDNHIAYDVNPEYI